MAEFRVIIDTLMMSFRGLVWSMLLVAGIIFAGAMLMSGVAIGALDDDQIELKSRIWLYERFGNLVRASYSMLEVTFTSGWITYARPLIWDISFIYVWLMLPYVICVNFAVMKVVSALFLKQTLAVAAKDEEKKRIALQEERKRFASELEEFFVDADTSKNGAISIEEFETMLSHDNVLEHFADLGLEIEEAVTLFTMLAQEDGEADYDEFVKACLKMRNGAQVIDIWMCMTSLTKTVHEIAEKLHERL